MCTSARTMWHVVSGGLQVLMARKESQALQQWLPSTSIKAAVCNAEMSFEHGTSHVFSVSHSRLYCWSCGLCRAFCTPPPVVAIFFFAVFDLMGETKKLMKTGSGLGIDREVWECLRTFPVEVFAQLQHMTPSSKCLQHPGKRTKLKGHLLSKRIYKLEWMDPLSLLCSAAFIKTIKRRTRMSITYNDQLGFFIGYNFA